MAVAFIVGLPVLAFAQEATTVKDLLDQFELYTFAGLMAAVLMLEEVVDRVWDLNGVASQVRSIVIGILGATVLAFFNLFMFADPAMCGGNPWYVCGPLVGAGAGLAANFAFLLPAVRGVLEGIGIRPKWAPELGAGSKPTSTNVRVRT